jgi:hypothetical protein
MKTLIAIVLLGPLFAEAKVICTDIGLHMGRSLTPYIAKCTDEETGEIKRGYFGDEVQITGGTFRVFDKNWKEKEERTTKIANPDPTKKRH